MGATRYATYQTVSLFTWGQAFQEARSQSTERSRRLEGMALGRMYALGFSLHDNGADAADVKRLLDFAARRPEPMFDTSGRA